jgi:predicted regulator of Ras-like GTPase activity (Roadblock/LC7/MglB family)
VIVDTQGGYLVVMAMSAGALLGVVADRGASLGTVAYEMALFVNRTSANLSPQLINELKNTVT